MQPAEDRDHLAQPGWVEPRHDLVETVAAINRDGVTVLLVEQNVRRALTLAHRAVVLENGRVVLAGPARELLADERLKKAYLGL